MEIQIRRATEADAVDAINTLHRSITELCIADHQGNAQELENWLGNKTVEAWKKWIDRDDAVVFVADRDNRVVGVGMATLSGTILLNYVHPDVRFSGVSKAILAALEEELRSYNVQHCRLESTITAQPFYERSGYNLESDNTSIHLKLL